MLKSDNLLDDCDLDPDINLFNCLTTVRYKYYLDDTSLAIVDKSFSSNVKLLHLNICSFAKNSDRLFNYLSNISTKFHFIALTETWTKSFNEEFVNYVGYNLVVKSRPDETRRGSAALLMKNFYQYASLTIIDNSLYNTFAFLAVSVKLLDSIVNLVVVYRPPGQVLSKFISEFEILLQVL